MRLIATVYGIKARVLKEIRIAVSLRWQQAIVAANRELIASLENKIMATLDRVWGEETIPFVLSLSKDCRSWFDKLTTNGQINRHGQARSITLIISPESLPALLVLVKDLYELA